MKNNDQMLRSNGKPTFVAPALDVILFDAEDLVNTITVSGPGGFFGNEDEYENGVYVVPTAKGVTDLSDLPN